MPPRPIAWTSFSPRRTCSDAFGGSTLWSRERQFVEWPFEKEADLEAAIVEAKPELFGEPRIYLDTKRSIGQAGKDPLRHVAQ